MERPLVYFALSVIYHKQHAVTYSRAEPQAVSER